MATAFKDPAFPASEIRHAWIELTHQCNLECLHCYTSSGPRVLTDEPLSDEKIFHILHDLRAEGCKSVQFIGGEATLHPGLSNFILEAHACGFSQIELFSNLTRLQNDVLEALQAVGGLLAFSMYSHNPNTHDTVTKRQGSFLKTLGGIKKAKSFGIKLRAGVISIPGINDNDLEATTDFLHSLGVDNVGSDRVRGFGRGYDLTQVSTDPFAELCGRCGQGSICIAPDGKVYPCIMARSWMIGDVSQGHLGTALRSDQLSEFRSSLRLVRGGAGHDRLDGCGPDNVCSPQVEGPPGCFPNENCTPDVVPCIPREDD